MKKFVLGFLVGALIFSIIPVSAAVQEYVLQKSDCKLIINGKEYANKELPMLNYKGYNYIPADSFRQICEQIGAKFEWENKTKEIRIDKAESKPENEEKETSPETKPDTPPVTSDVTSPVIKPEVMDIVNADSLQKVNQDDLTGIKYNNIFYVNLDEATKSKYNLVTSHKKDENEYTVISAITGELINLSRNLDGYIESTDGIIYCRYDKISRLFHTIPTQPTQSKLEPVPTAEVDKLEVIEKDGMKGVMYNGVFYVEKDSFNSKYRFNKDGYIEIDISIIDDVCYIVTKQGKTTTLKNDKDGFIKNSKGICYINFDKLKSIMN